MSESAARSMARMFQMMSQMIETEKDHLSELDGAIGDGDHGITGSRDHHVDRLSGHQCRIVEARP